MRLTGCSSLVALLVVAGVGCGDDEGGDGAGGGGGTCGTADDPTLLVVSALTPPLGGTAENPVSMSFTVEDSPGVLQELFLVQGPNHTAGNPTNQFQVGAITQGTTVIYEVAPLEWGTVPGRVELSAQTGFQDGDGCFYVLPSPLWDFDVEPGPDGMGGSGAAGGMGGSSNGGGSNGGQGGGGQGGGGQGGGG